MAEKIKVISSQLKAREDESEYLECILDDGSTWTCDTDGTNWEKAKLSNDELTESLYTVQKVKAVPYQET